MPTTTIQYFEYEHLSGEPRKVAEKLFKIAHEMEDTLPDGPEKAAGMRLLLQAKDCFVRCALPVKG